MPRRNLGGRGFLVNNLRTAADKLLKTLRIKNAAVGVFLLNGQEMLGLKSRFKKGKKGLHPAAGRAVDVLAFPEPKGFPHPETKTRYLGDIYLNQDMGGQKERLIFLLVHGLLHLLGFSHDRRHDTLKMESLEKKLLNKLKM